jgi:hypothetical protein
MRKGNQCELGGNIAPKKNSKKVSEEPHISEATEETMTLL